MPMKTEDDYYMETMEDKKLQKLHELETAVYFNTSCHVLCAGPLEECKKDIFKEGLCKSHYNSYKLRGRKRFDQYQLNLRHKLQRKNVPNVKHGPNIQYKTLLYKQELERRNLIDEQSTYANSKEDDEADKREVRKYIVKEIKDQANEIIRTIDVNMYNIREGNLRVARGNSRHIHESMQQYFDKCYLQDVIRDPRVQQSYDNMTNAIMEKEDELTNEAIQQEQREIEEIERGELEEFVNDGQNVHRLDVVNMVVETYRRILDNVIVPDEYKWSKQTISKTIGEIITECELPTNVGVIMLKKYLEADTIYDIEAAYPKILDAVWQFIKNHDDKACLVKTLKIELTDNVGMCQQGNLTRLCNILSGYMEGIQLRPLAEQLGDLLPPLMEEPNERIRLEKARGILRSLRVPDQEWDNWLDPLRDEEDEDERVSREREMVRMMA